MISTLHERCRAFLREAGVRGMLRWGDPVLDLHDFVLSERGAAADERLEGMRPLVLYFRTDEERKELIDAIQQAKPGMITRHWP